MNTIDNSLNFKAKLDVRNVKGNKARWQNIAKIFENKTQRYPKDNVSIWGSFSDGLDLYLVDKMGKLDESANIYKNASKKMKDFSDERISEIIKRLFILKRQTNIMYQKAELLAKSLGFSGNEVGNKEEDIFWETIVDLNKKRITKQIEKDNFIREHNSKNILIDY